MGAIKKHRATTNRKRNKRKITLSLSSQLIHKNDATRVYRASGDTIPKAPAKTVLPTNGITFKVKIRKK